MNQRRRVTAGPLSNLNIPNAVTTAKSARVKIGNAVSFKPKPANYKKIKGSVSGAK